MIQIPAGTAANWVSRDAFTHSSEVQGEFNDRLEEAIRDAWPKPVRPLAVGDKVDRWTGTHHETGSPPLPLIHTFTIRYADADIAAGVYEVEMTSVSWSSVGTSLWRVGEDQPAPFPEP